jgi:hypothetical protein
MTRINTGKMLVGGLVAGLVANVLDIIWNMAVLMDDGEAMVARLNLDPALMTSAAGWVPWIVVDFLLGILLVFAYAAMRPRFGPGVKTAVIAGLTLYLAVSFVLFGFTSMGIFTMSMYVKSSACALVTVLAASIAGAAIYKE